MVSPLFLATQQQPSVSKCQLLLCCHPLWKQHQGAAGTRLMLFSPQATLHSLQHKLYLLPVVDTVSGRYLRAELMTECFKSIVCAYTVRDWPCLADMIAMWESVVGVDWCRPTWIFSLSLSLSSKPLFFNELQQNSSVIDFFFQKLFFSLPLLYKW